MAGEEHDAGTLHIDVVADYAGFARQLKAKVKEAAEKAVAQVKVEFRLNKRDLSRDVKAAASGVTAKIPGQVQVKASQIRQAVRDATPKTPPRIRVDATFSAPQVRRAAREVAAAAKATVRVEAEIRGAQLRRAVRDAAKAAGATVSVDLSVSAAQKAKVKAEIARIKGTVDVDADTSKARTTLTKFTSFLRGALGGPLGFIIDPSKWSAFGAALKGVLGVMSGAGKLLAIGAGIGAIGGAVVQALAALKALAPALGVIGLVPAIAFGAAASIGVLKLAFSGLGAVLKDVFSGKAVDPEQFARLGTSAQKLVGQLQKVAPVVDDIRKAVSNDVLLNVDKDVADLAQQWLPMLREQLTGVAIGWNVVIRNSLGFLKTPQVVRDVASALTNVRDAVGNLDGVGRAVLSVFVDLTTVGSTFLPGMARGVNGLAEEFAAFIRSARESGQLAGWIQTGIQTVSQLGRIVGEVGGIIQAVFHASALSGGGLLNNLELVLGKVQEFLNSTAGQTALQTFFVSLSTILQVVLPIVTALAGAIGTTLAPALAGIVSILGPSLLPVIEALRVGIDALAPGLKIFASGLGEGLKALSGNGALAALGKALGDGLAALGPVLPSVGRALSDLVIAAAPLLPVAGQLLALILQLASVGLSNLTRLLGPIIAALSSGLAPALGAVTRLFTAWMPLVGEIAGKIGGDLGNAMQRVVPKLAEIAVKIVDGLLPHLPEFAEILSKCADVFGEIADEAATGLVQALDDLSPYIPQLVAAFVQLALASIQFLPVAVRILAWALAMITPIVNVGLFMSAFGDKLKGAARAVGEFVRDGIAGWVKFFEFVGSIPDKIGAALASAWRAVKGWFSSAGKDAEDGISGIWRWAQELPGKIGTYLSELPGKLTALIGGAIESAASAFFRGVGLLIGYALAIPQLLINAINELPAKAAAWWTKFWTDTSTQASNGIDSLIAWVNGIPDRAIAAASGLYLQAQTWWNGLWRDISLWASNGIDSFLVWINAIPGRAMAALSSLGALLGGLFASAWAWARQAVSDGINNLINLVYSLPGRISALGGQLWQAGQNLINSLLSGLQSLGAGLANVAASIVNGIKRGLNWVIGKINEGISSVDKIPGVSLPRIPYLARGDIVDKPTTAVIGEDGREVVVPMTKPRRAVELAQKSGLVALLRQYGAFVQGPVPAGAGTAPPLRGATPAPQPTAPPLRGVTVNLTGAQMTAEEQLTHLGNKIAWILRGRPGRG